MNRQTALLSGLAVVLVVALWWVFLFSPGREEIAQLEDDIAAAQTEQASLNQRIAQLEQVRASAPETEALISRLGGIVPADDPALPGAQRQIAAAAADAGADVSQFTASRPAPVAEEGAPAGLHTISLSMTVGGSYFQLVDFLRRLEDPAITARGITFESLNVAIEEYPTLTGTLTGTMYAVLDPVPEAGEQVQAPDPEATPSPGATEGDDADVDVDVDVDTDGDATEGEVQ